MIQKVKLKKGETPSRSAIVNALTKAKSSFDYARYDMPNGKYISVNFNKDNTYLVTTNSRDYGIVYDIKVLHSVNSFYNLCDFMVRWIKKLNK